MNAARSSLYVGGEEAFREKWGDNQEAPMSWGADDCMMLTAHQVMPTGCSVSHDIKHAFMTGYIKRSSFETISGGSTVLEDDAPYSHFAEAELSGKPVKNLHPNEHATCQIIQGKGLVVINLHGHVGLIITAKAAMAVSGITKLHAVIGGFHLGPAEQDYIEHTIDDLEALNPDVVLPMHYSGTNFINAMPRRMPHKLVTSNTGSVPTFTA